MTVRRFHVPLVLGVVVCILLIPRAAFGGPEKKAAQTDKLFGSIDVLRLSIELGETQMASLKKEPRKNVSCSLKEADTTYADVAIHVKGGIGSFRPIDAKPA